jgi:hypothetical protein
MPANGTGKGDESAPDPLVEEQDEIALDMRVNDSSIPIFDAAIESDTVSLALLAHAYEEMEKSEDEFTKRVNAKYIPDLTAALHRNLGPVEDASFFPVYGGAAAILKDNNLYVSYDPLSPVLTKKVEELFWELETISNEMQTTLEGEEHKVISDKLYALACHLLSTLDAKTSDPKLEIENRFLFAEEEFLRIKMTYATTALRDAQVRYLRGVLIGTGFLWISLLILVLVLNGLTGDGRSSVWELVASTAFFGTVGADVSVLSRITFGKLHVDYIAGNSMLRLLGAFRPVIGAILGVALFALIYGSILPLEYPGVVLERLFFFGGVAFLAGFSERWAQDMLGSAGNRLKIT